MNIKEKIIKKLRGFTEKEYGEALFINKKDYVNVGVDSLLYYLDEDSLEFEKEQLAYKLGKFLLDNELIKYDIEKKRDNLYCKIYVMSAQVKVIR